MEPTLAPVLDAVFPVFGLVACGVLAGRFRLVNPGSSEALNRFVYAFALPALLFVAVYRGSLDEILGTSEEQFGLAILADNLVYVVWLPLLLMSRDFADRFNRWARVPADRVAAMEAAAEVHVEADRAPEMPQYLYLAAIVVGAVAYTTDVNLPALAIGIGLVSLRHSAHAGRLGDTGSQ